jgi:hypothetical protein
VLWPEPPGPVKQSAGPALLSTATDELDEMTSMSDMMAVRGDITPRLRISPGQSVLIVMTVCSSGCFASGAASTMDVGGIPFDAGS